MKFKVLITFFIALSAVNVSANSTAFTVESYKTTVVEVFNKVLKISTTFLNEANSLVHAIETDQKQIEGRLVSLGITKSKQINSLVLNGIDYLLRNTATDDGKAVIDCIKAEKGKTDSDITMVIGDFGTCAVGKAPKVLAEVKSIIARLTELKNDVQDQTDTLSSCSKDQLTCLLDFATTMLETLEKTLSYDKTGYKEITDSVSRISVDVAHCIRDVGMKIGTKVQEEFNEVIVCTKKT